MFGILLTLIFIRPFISSLAFPYLNALYSGLFLFFLIIWVIYKGTTIEKIHTLKYPLILFCSALIISVVFSIDKLNSLKELYKYINGILLFLIVASLTSENKIRLMHTVILAGLIISLLAIYQYSLGFRHTLDYMSREKIINPFASDYIQRKRAFFPFVTPNVLADYLIMIIPLTLTIPKNRIWFILPLSFALLLTQSVGAFLSILLALVIYLYLQGKFEKRKVLFLTGLLLIIGLTFMLRSATQKQHLQPIFSTVMRLNYWKDTFRIIKASPLTGIGLGNFNLIQSRYSHNSYLQIWAEMGILGIAAWLWLIFISFNIGFKKLKKNGDQQGSITISLILASTVFLIHNLIDFSFFLPEVALIWWIIVGLISG